MQLAQALITAASCLLAVSSLAQEPAGPPRPPALAVPRVSTFEALRPTTADDRALAEWLDDMTPSSTTPRQLYDRGGGMVDRIANQPLDVSDVVIPCYPVVVTRTGTPVPCDPVEDARRQRDVIRQRQVEQKRRRLCESDGVAVGRITEVRVFLTASERSLWTRYRVAIDRWIYPVTGASDVTIAAAGGTVEIGNARVSIVYGGGYPASGAILVTLRRVPNTSGYIGSTERLSGAEAFSSDTSIDVALAIEAAASCT